MTNQKNSKAFHISLWVVQIALAIAFGMAGLMKVSKPIPELAANGMGFVNHMSESMVRFIGSTQILGAIGLILPAALRIKPILTPMAAIGIAIIMILAIREHVTHHEPIVANLVLLGLAAFVAWGRFAKAPIQAK